MRKVGILGGMGPAATAGFYTTLVRATPATRDQEHLPVVIWADPTIPDRSAALLDDGPDPTPWLMAGAQSLRDAGAELIVVPCNTVHAFLPAVVSAVGVPTLDMVGETVSHLRAHHREVTRVGLLGSSGTVRTGLYAAALSGSGVELVVPTDDEQEEVIAPSIAAIKAGDIGDEIRSRVASAANRLVTRGAEVLIEGCTEFPLVLRGGDVAVPLIDPGEVLARAVVNSAWKARKVGRG
jgi:aspartate racemase